MPRCATLCQNGQPESDRTEGCDDPDRWTADALKALPCGPAAAALRPVPGRSDAAPSAAFAPAATRGFGGATGPVSNASATAAADTPLERFPDGGRSSSADFEGTGLRSLRSRRNAATT